MSQCKSVLFLAALFSLLITLSITPTYAQDVFSETDLLSEDDEMLFQEIPSVYSASKYEQKVSKAPQLSHKKTN